MALFKFKVSDQAGKISEQLIEGDSRDEATRRLQQRGMFPLKFLGEGSSDTKPVSGLGWGGLRFDLADFTDRLVPLLEAHVPLERSLEITADGMTNTNAANVVMELRRGLHEGRTLSQMLRDRSHIFPEMYASMVEVGEETGCLPEVLADMRRYLNERRELMSYIVSASIYPICVLSVSLGIVGFLLGVIIPKFARELQNVGADIPVLAKWLFGTAMCIQSYWWVFILLAVFIGVSVVFLRRKATFQNFLAQLTLKLPFFRTVVTLSNYARMARTMSILIRNGVHILQTMTISVRVVQHQKLRESLGSVTAELRQGTRLAAALQRSPYVPAFMLRMVEIGEETGSVDEMLSRTAERFESDLRRLINRALSLFEPAVIVLLGGFVGLIVIVMFSAIMKMRGTI